LANTSVESVGRILPRGLSVDDSSDDVDKRRKTMSSFRQTSVDETRFTPVEKFESIKFESIEESDDASLTASFELPSTRKSESQTTDETEDTVELIPRFENNNDNCNMNNNNVSSKKTKSSPLRRLGFPLSRAMTLPTQTL
jgi:pyruvate formate-lyase activating enzyme-like uncharacterized protein